MTAFATLTAIAILRASAMATATITETMTIEYGAFQNCVSLKEIHFEKCTEVVNTNIYNCNVPDDMKIIVNDKLYSKSMETELPANQYRLISYSDYLQEKLEKTENYCIIKSIIYLNDVVRLISNDNVKITIVEVVEFLMKKYQIEENQVLQLQKQIYKIKELKDES